MSSPDRDSSHKDLRALPLLACSAGSISVQGVRLLEFDHWGAEGHGCCLVGDFSPLLAWLLQEAELDGRIEVGGMVPHDALRKGALGLGLASSDFDPSWTVGGTLEASASLVGASSAQVRRTLDRTRLARHRQVRLGELPLPLRRLLQLAMASVTEPAVLFLERPFAGLDDEAAQFVETILWDLSAQSRWIAWVDTSTPWERRLCEHADAGVFVAREGRIVGPFDSETWLAGPQVFWVHLTGADAPDALRAEGSRVERGPGPDTWIVWGLSGRRIAELAGQAGAELRELVPLSHRASCY